MSPEPRRRRGTPISDSLGADLQVLGSILASHTRGLDAYLNRQAQRLEERQQTLLAEAPGLLRPPDLDLDTMTTAELREMCRRQRWRRWSKLRRADLLAFVRQQLDAEATAGQVSPDELVAPEPSTDLPPAPSDASRSERLLLLLLHHLGVPQEQVEQAWRAPGIDP